MYSKPRSFNLCVIFIAAIFLAACGNIGTEDSTDVAGHYEASAFTVETDNTSIDVLERDGMLRITLDDDGTVEGRLFVPCSIPGACESDESANFEADFEGIYEMNGATVQFDHRADTFIRDAEWTYQHGTLSTSFEVGGSSITVELIQE